MEAIPDAPVIKALKDHSCYLPKKYDFQWARRRSCKAQWVYRNTTLPEGPYGDGTALGVVMAKNQKLRPENTCITQHKEQIHGKLVALESQMKAASK